MFTRHLYLIVALLILTGAASGQTVVSNTPDPPFADETGYLFSSTKTIGDTCCAVGSTGTELTTRGWTATTNAPHLASPKFGDMDGDGVAEIVFSTYGISNPYAEGYIHVWDGNGTELTGFPFKTSGPLPGSPAIGDLDGDGSMEIVQGSWNYLYVLNDNGTSFPGWPKPMTVNHSAALADLDDDGDLEILVPIGAAMRAYHHDGSAVTGFPVGATNSLTEPAIGDLDGDGDLEILAGSYVPSGSVTDYVYAWNHDGSPVSGFPVTTAGSVKVAPALADLDSDGTLEVIADCWSKSATDFLYVWDHNGNSEPGWPINIGYIRLSSPSVADLDLDGDLEIIVGGLKTTPSFTEQVNAHHHNADAVTGFPVDLPNLGSAGNINSTPVVGDIDGDEQPEIVVKGYNQIHALNADGTMVSGFPLFLDDESHSSTISPSPALGDPDGDGLVEIFAASSFDNVALYDHDAIFSFDLLSWPTFRVDQHNKGVHAHASLAADLHVLSAGSAGTVDFIFDAGVENAGDQYFLMCGISGAWPGKTLPGGLVVPCNWDPIVMPLVRSLNNIAIFFDFIGTLDGLGQASPRFEWPGYPGSAGLKIYFAGCTIYPFDFVTNAVQVEVE